MLRAGLTNGASFWIIIRHVMLRIAAQEEDGGAGWEVGAVVQSSTADLSQTA